MADCTVLKSDVELRLSLSLGEAEARALHAISVYGDDAMVHALSIMLGVNETKKHENGLRSLARAARFQVAEHLHRCDKARAVFKADM
jgi:hypothetical protein